MNCETEHFSTVGRRADTCGHRSTEPIKQREKESQSTSILFSPEWSFLTSVDLLKCNAGLCSVTNKAQLCRNPLKPHQLPHLPPSLPPFPLCQRRAASCVSALFAAATGTVVNRNTHTHTHVRVGGSGGIARCQGAGLHAHSSSQRLGVLQHF